MQDPVNLRPLLEAKSVAIVGASADPLKVGGRPIEYLRRYGFDGRVVPINPNRAVVQGLACARSLSAVEPVDLAIVAAPAEGAEDAITQCCAAGVKAVVLFTAGFAEVNESGRSAQQRLASLASGAGVTLLGPNCLGAINTRNSLVATFTTALEPGMPLPQGPVSYLGQSGALGAYWLQKMVAAELGFAKWITTGNEAQLGIADALAYLADDPDTRVIAAYIEDIKQPELFVKAAARARATGKSIVAIRAGRSPAGARAVSAHTGADTGRGREMEQLFTECAIVTVHSLTEMVDVARLVLATSPIPWTPRLGVVTVSGGAGALICDAAHDAGLNVPDIPEALRAALDDILPHFVRRQNPIDVTAAVVSNTRLLGDILIQLARSDGCDVIVLFLGLMASIKDGLVAEVRKVQACGKPILVIWMGCTDESRAALESIGIPVFGEIPAAITAIAQASRTRQERALVRG